MCVKTSPEPSNIISVPFDRRRSGNGFLLFGLESVGRRAVPTETTRSAASTGRSGEDRADRHDGHRRPVVRLSLHHCHVPQGRARRQRLRGLSRPYWSKERVERPRTETLIPRMRRNSNQGEQTDFLIRVRQNTEAEITSQIRDTVSPESVSHWNGSPFKTRTRNSRELGEFPYPSRTHPV